MAEALITADAIIRIEVVYALPERQLLIALAVPEGTTAQAAVAIADLARRVPGFEAGTAGYGLFGKVVPGTHPLRAGDRVDVLRPLRADPKEVRRSLAAQGRTMGKPKG